MKRTATALALAFAAAALLTGASVWEGAAVAAAAGELPDSGYYVATNAFPRNTVVDVKNLENDKTVRAIVSGGLDSPGLLASLSREAASEIGMNFRDIGRVRMTMPADPIAFGRFNEGFEPSGDPDHDPQAAIAAAAVPTEPLQSEALVPEESKTTPAGNTEVSAEKPAETPLDIVEGVEEAPLDEVPAMNAVPTEADALAEVPPPVSEDRIAEVPLSSTGTPPETPIAEPESPAEADAPVSPPESAVTDVVLVPAEERPPDASLGGELAPGAEVAPLGEAGAIADQGPVVSGAAAESEPFPSESEIATIESGPAAASPVVREVPDFGAPVIAGLEKGKYYLQLGAFGKADAVAAEVAKHGKSYPLAIQSAGSLNKPVYRVLVGPVNLGESGALLQRFKRSGYKDAFVKQGS